MTSIGDHGRRMTERYRVYIGEATPEDVARLTSQYVSGATITPGTGLWEGQTEPTTIVEVVDYEGTYTLEYIATFAEAARRAFRQSAVLITQESVEVRLVTATPENVSA